MKKQKLIIMWSLLSVVFTLLFAIVKDCNQTTTPELIFISLTFGCWVMIAINMFGGKSDYK